MAFTCLCSLHIGDTGKVNCLSWSVLTLSTGLDHGKKLHGKLLISVSCRARGITVSLSAHACSEAEIFLGLRAQGVSFLKGKRWFRGSCWGKLPVKTKVGKRNAISVIVEDWAYQGYWGIVSLVSFSLKLTRIWCRSSLLGRDKAFLHF